MNIIKKTPLQYCNRLSNKFNAQIFLKREDLQIVRSFKVRGVYNKIIKNFNINNHYITASAGNHAQGLAHISNLLNLKSTIFIPENTPLQKIQRIKYFSNDKCNLIKSGTDFNSCLNFCYDFCNHIENDNNKKIFIHPFDDMDVIEGQGEIGRK